MDRQGADAYIDERLADQIDYHDRKAMRSQRAFRRLTALAIAAVSLTPLMLALDKLIAPTHRTTLLQDAFGVLPILVSVVAAVATVSLTAFKHKETWITHRSTCEALRREVHRFRYDAVPYRDAEDPCALLVDRTEAIMEADAAAWKDVFDEPTAVEGGGLGLR